VLRSRSRRRTGGDEGSAALELAVIGPTLFILIFFVIQVALYFYGRSVALQSAREGVSQLRVAQSAAEFDHAEPGVATSVQDFAAKVGSGALNGATMSADHDDAYDRVRVTVKGDAISLVPWMTWTVTQSASGVVEKFR
jgi:Flp pilus assembly protein TadG